MKSNLADFRTTLMTKWRSGLDVASMLALADAATTNAGGDAVSFVLDEWFDQVLGAQLPESTAEFACHGAVLQLKNGYCGENPVERVFTAVAATNPDVPPRFLETGTGRLPQEFQSVGFDGLSISANDVTGVISIDFTVENGQTVRFAVEFLERILRDTDFPRELNIQVTGLTGDYVPMPELPKIGMSQLFMSAVSYPLVRESVVRYAREAMKYDFFYGCPELSYETGKNIQLGGVAVFALGLTDLGKLMWLANIWPVPGCGSKIWSFTFCVALYTSMGARLLRFYLWINVFSKQNWHVAILPWLRNFGPGG